MLALSSAGGQRWQRWQSWQRQQSGKQR